MTRPERRDDWADCSAKTAGRPARPLFDRLRSIYLQDPAVRSTVDLGCGDGTETLLMLHDGLTVAAIDGSAASIEIVRKRAGSNPALLTIQARLEEVDVPQADLIYSGLALPFCHPHAFHSLWDRLLGSLRPGALMAVHLFGDRHGWSTQQDMTFVDVGQVEDLLSGLEVIDLREIDEVGPTATSGPVGWHIFDVIARARTSA